MTAPTEPQAMTLEEAIQLLGPDEVLLVGYCGWEGMQYSVVEESSVKFLTHSYGKWEDALTDILDRKIVARDDAAELRAALKRIHTMFSSTIGDSTAELNRKLVLKVPYAMGIARQTLEKTSDAALAATEGQS